jgi:carboxypeptidase D
LTASATSLDLPASVTLEATGGDNIKWYDSELDGNLLATGSSYETDIVETSTTFWASSSHITSGDLVSGGEMETQTGGQYHSNNNRWLEFDAYEDMLLRSITVYANGAYDRTFELIDNFDNVLATTTIFVEDGENVLDLNFEVPAGDNYGLRSATNDPQLWREGTDSELSYPYPLGSIGSITQSTAGPSFSYYYFFYNWQAEPLPIACESDRASISVSVSGLSELFSAAQFSPELSPNPALSSSHVSITNFPTFPCEVSVSDISGRVIFIGSSNVISLHGINAGTYIISVLRQSDDVVLGVSRLIVQ